MRFSVKLFYSIPKAVKPTTRQDRSVVNNDRIRLFIRAGSGGNGLSLYNGIGGSGGFVYAQPVERLNFDRFCAQFEEKAVVTAGDGEPSKQTKLVGRHGRDKILKVPVGVEIVSRDNLLLARCKILNQKYVLATGGQGGCASNNFKGEKGDAYWVQVNLKLTPNIGLIGYPNAGKSTLTKALVPNKNIEIASYPFTTQKPQMCYIKYGKERKSQRNNDNQFTLDTLSPDIERQAADEVSTPFSLSIADLPGIVEGAARNRFSAFDCLKHLEYSEIIVMIVDVHGFQLGPNEPHRSPLETMALLNREMEAYDRALVRKPILLIINKVDIDNGEQKAAELCDFLLKMGPTGTWANRIENEEIRPRYPICFRSIHAISAKEKRLGNVKEVLKDTYKTLRKPKKAIFEEDDTMKKDQKMVTLE